MYMHVNYVDYVFLFKKKKLSQRNIPFVVFRTREDARGSIHAARARAHRTGEPYDTAQIYMALKG